MPAISKLITEGIKSRVRRPSLFSKLTTVDDLIASGFFKDGMRMGWVKLTIIRIKQFKGTIQS
jgi:hypothetical protein